jgi:hypothetical protein
MLDMSLLSLGTLQVGPLLWCMMPYLLTVRWPRLLAPTFFCSSAGGRRHKRRLRDNGSMTLNRLHCFQAPTYKLYSRAISFQVSYIYVVCILIMFAFSCTSLLMVACCLCDCSFVSFTPYSHSFFVVAYICFAFGCQKCSYKPRTATILRSTDDAIRICE